MLTSTFIHIPRVGPVTERRIWGRGIRSWDDFVRDPGGAQLSGPLTDRVRALVEQSRDRLASGDYRFFSGALAAREQWRAYPEFRHRIAYLDIETTGLAEGDDITLIGVYDGATVRTYLKGRDLDAFPADIRRFGLIVTFFGTGFDLPWLRHRFPRLALDQLHVDLCYALRRLGLTGGLKHIEDQLDIARSPETEGLSGWDAVRLWREWERGSEEALDLLTAYNREDIVNLERLMQYAYHRLHAKTGIPLPAGGAAA